MGIMANISARKKQIIYPLTALVLCVVAAVGFASLKKPPEVKKSEEVTHLVNVEPVTVTSMQLFVNSQGVITPQYETRLVAQVSGEIITLAKEFVRGGVIRKGQLLAQIDPSDYESQLLRAESDLAAANAALEIEQAEVRVAEAEWRNIKGKSPSKLSLRKPQLAQAKAKVKAAQAAVKRAKRDLERSAIVAPFDALIQARQIGLGAYVTAGTEVGKVLSVADAEVRLPVADAQLKFLEHGGIEAAVTLSADYAGDLVNWPATIVRSEGVVDENTRMTYLVARIDDPYSHPLPLRFGTYVTASISGVSLPGAVAIPRHLLDGNKVALLDNESKLRFKEVDIIRRQGTDVVVTNLQNGDRVITSALDYPVEGMKLSLLTDKTEADKPNESGRLAMTQEP